MQAGELKKDTLGVLHSVALGIAGTAPSFSISATMATLIAAVGILSPASLLYSGALMFGIAVAYAKLNSMKASAGAAYAWVGEIFTPALGFFSGWALLCSSALFMVSATVPAGAATLLIVKPEWADNKVAVTLVSMGWLFLVSWGVQRGALFSGRAMMLTAGFEMITLAGLGVLTLMHPVHAASLSLSVFTPWSFSLSGFASGAVIAVFFYWGWDVALNFSEETKQSTRTPGLGALIAAVLLVAVFVGFAATAIVTLTGSETASAGTNILFAVATKLLPAPLAYVAVLALMLSTIGTLQTSISQFSRMLFAKSRDGALPKVWSRLHPRYHTPEAGILLNAVLGAILLVLSLASQSLADTMKASINAIGAQAAFYYGLAGIACAWHCWGTGYNGIRNFLILVVWPGVSALTLLAAAVVTLDQSDIVTNVFAIGGIAIGIVPWWLWGRKAELAKASAG